MSLFEACQTCKIRLAASRTCARSDCPHFEMKPCQHGIRWPWVCDACAEAALRSLAAGRSADGDLRERIAVPLVWKETLADRGDGSFEISGWEANSGFNTWYAIEIESDSFHLTYDYDPFGVFDDPDAAKEYAQADFEKRLRALVSPALAVARREVAEAGLDLSELRRVSHERQQAWCPDQVPDLSFRGVELAGETGEACNVIKKLERERLGWRGSRATLDELADELADVVICADLAAMAANVDLSAAVVRKFNATSDKVGLPHKLRVRPPIDAQSGADVGQPGVK